MQALTDSRSPLVMLDLFAGLGGASAAMRARGWHVVTVDNDPSFGCTHTADLSSWTYSGPPVDLVWASPPCVEFSRTLLPWIKDAPKPSLDLVRAALRIVAEVRPRFWLLENVRGALPFLRPVLGPPVLRNCPVFLWGVPPPLMAWPRIAPWKEALAGSDRAGRAKIPAAISEAVADGVEAARW